MVEDNVNFSYSKQFVMKLEDLQKDVQNYKKAILEIDRKRTKWNAVTKDFILKVITKIKNSYDLDWSVFVLETTKNVEGINLVFGNSFSGVYSENDNGTRSYSRTGGNLLFSQAYNGDVLVLLLYPNIVEVDSFEETQKTLAKVDPSKIDEDFIIQKVSEFLSDMTDWESSRSSHAVGFKI